MEKFGFLNWTPILLVVFIGINFVVAQQPEVSQDEKTLEQEQPTSDNPPSETGSIIDKSETQPNSQSLQHVGPKAAEPSLFQRIKSLIMIPIRYFLSTPKVNTVLRNVATCVVNGAMEIVSYYFPAPFIPLMASLAGMMVPFEPILMLRDKLPVTSYRRAFLTALNTFLGTFDKYKIEDNYEYDPYMTQRFHRRMMNFQPEKENERFQ